MEWVSAEVVQALVFISKEVGNRPATVTWSQFFIQLMLQAILSLLKMLPLLALVSAEDKVMKESDKVIEVEREKLARIEEGRVF